MDDLRPEVLRAFDYMPDRIIKEKNTYILYGNGLRQVTKSRCSAERLVFAHQIKEKLAGAGFKNTDRFYLSGGLPYFELDGELYTMTETFTGLNADLSDSSVLLACVRNTAAMHAILVENKFSDAFIHTESLADSYKPAMETFAQLKKMLSTKKRLSDFDVILMKNQDYFFEQAEEWKALSERSGYARAEEKALVAQELCHNLLKEEYLSAGAITNFTECAVRPQINDLAELVRRHFFSCGGKQALPLSEIAEAYNGVKPLSANDAAMLRAVLTYPDKFIKIASACLSRKRSWVPGTYVNRLAICVGAKDVFREYINT